MRFRVRLVGVRLVGEDVPDVVNAMVAVVAVEGVLLAAHRSDHGMDSALLSQADALGEGLGPGHHPAVRPSLGRMENPQWSGLPSRVRLVSPAG